MPRDELDIPVPGQGAATGGRYASSRGEGRLDPGTRNILIFVGGAVLVVGLIAGGMAALSPVRSGVPVVEANPKPLRERPPAPPQGVQTASLTNEVDGKPVVVAAPETPSLTDTKPAPTTVAKVTPPAPAPAPVPAPVTAPPSPPSLAAAPVPAPQLAPVPVRPAPPVVAQAPVPAAATRPSAAPKPGTPAVQLAALSSEEAAMAEWQRLTKRYPDLLGSRHPVVSRTAHDGKTYYRLRTGGFTDTASASSFCGLVKSRGANCAVATF